MNKSDFTGWKEVFSFTFAQTVKQKAYVIFLVIFSVIALLYSTGSSLVMQYQEHRESKAVVSQVVIFDQTGLSIDYSNAFTSKGYENVAVEANPSKSFEEYEKQMEKTADETMLIQITFQPEEEEYKLLFVQGKNVSLSELAKVEFEDAFCSFLEEARMEAVGISKEQQDYIQTDISWEVKELSENGDVIEKASDSISSNDYFITLGLLMVCMMLINISGSQIALAIVTEKSSRVLEYLVLHVRPLALIVGKLVATIATSLLQMITIGFCYIASPIISNLITPRLSQWLFGASQSDEISAALAEETLASTIEMIHNMRVEFIFLALLFIVLGIVFYGIIAGLLGASVSKMDEMQESMSLFQILLVIGCYADLALCVLQLTGKANPALSKVLSICPITSPFLVPSNLLLGKMSWGLILVSIAVMLICIVFLFALTANVYEAMIFYNGKVLKVKDILALASSKKKVARKGEDENEK